MPQTATLDIPTKTEADARMRQRANYYAPEARDRFLADVALLVGTV